MSPTQDDFTGVQSAHERSEVSPQVVGNAAAATDAPSQAQPREGWPEGGGNSRQAGADSRAAADGDAAGASSAAPAEGAEREAEPTPAERLQAILNQEGRPLTREDLMEQGMPPAQADAVLVRLHADEVLRLNFRRWIYCFSLLVCLLTPAMLGILVWMAVAYMQDRKKDCDVPLQTWVHVVSIVVIYNSTINRPTQHGSLVVRLCCRWTRDPHNPEPTPIRVRLYSACVTTFIFVWNCIGLHWVRISGEEPADLPSCRGAAPDLLNAVKVYASFNLAFTIFMYINMVGFAHLLRTAMYRGMLHTSNAAPKGALEKHAVVIPAGDPVLLDQDKCPICLEEFGPEPTVRRKPSGGSLPTWLARRPSSKENLFEIVKLNSCGHCFHRNCIQGWLNVNRVCPVCRADVCGAPS